MRESTHTYMCGNDPGNKNDMGDKDGRELLDLQLEMKGWNWVSLQGDTWSSILVTDEKKRERMGVYKWMMSSSADVCLPGQVRVRMKKRWGMWKRMLENHFETHRIRIDLRIYRVEKKQWTSLYFTELRCSLLLRQAGGPLLLGSHQIDTELSMSTLSHIVDYTSELPDLVILLPQSPKKLGQWMCATMSSKNGSFKYIINTLFCS